MDLEAELRALKLRIAKMDVRFELLEELFLKAVSGRAPTPAADHAPAVDSPPAAGDSKLVSLRKKHPNHGRAWASQDRELLIETVRGDREISYESLTHVLGRTPSAIQTEVFRLRRSNIVADSDLDRIGILDSYVAWMAKQP